MRVVLRVEVEAVKFLKEEPQRLDALLKRCNTVTDALSTLRRYQLLLFAHTRFLDSVFNHFGSFSVFAFIFYFFAINVANNDDCSEI